MPEHQFKGRREDARLITGRGRYTDDAQLPGEAAGQFLRSDRPHARIVKIDATKARELKGVIDILTSADLVAAGWKGLPATAFFKGVGGSSLHVPFRTGLAHERVRFVGEPVALVVAETVAIAQDATELIEVEYEDLTGYVEASEAGADGAQTLHDGIPGNLAFDYEYGNQQAADEAFAKAAHVVRAAVRAQRIAANPMEPKSCVATYDAANDAFELWAPSQGTADLRNALSLITGVPFDRIHVHSDDVGGGFGIRNEVYPEFVAVMLAAKKTGRAVKWRGTRGETLSGDHHARAADLSGELALDNDGRFLGVRVRWLVNVGAYCANSGPLINTIAAPTSSAISLYNVTAIYGRHRLVFTNTTPTTAYRGAGRPNVAYLWERLVEEAAIETGIDAVKLRRMNFLKKTAFPMKTPTGSMYDSADPDRLLKVALEAADWKGFSKRQRQSKKAGRLRGIGLALFLDRKSVV